MADGLFTVSNHTYVSTQQLMKGFPNAHAPALSLTPTPAVERTLAICPNGTSATFIPTTDGPEITRDMAWLEAGMRKLC